MIHSNQKISIIRYEGFFITYVMAADAEKHVTGNKYNNCPNSFISPRITLGIYTSGN